LSQENVEVIRRALKAMTLAQAHRRRDGSFRERDTLRAFALLASDHELIPYMTRVEGTSFRGAEGYRRWIERLDDAWESYEVTPEQFIEVDGDRVLVAYRFCAQSRLQGIPVDEQLAWIVTVRDGKLARTEAYASVSEALKAVGLEE
jgi:ketosteroid isomerase-like protein